MKDLDVVKDTETEIVIRHPLWVLAVGWLLVFMGVCFIVLYLLRGPHPYFSLTDWPYTYFVSILLILVGILIESMRTKITFSQPAGYLTRAWGFSEFRPIFRTPKRISKEEAKSVFVNSKLRHPLLRDELIGPYSYTSYQVKIKMTSGKEPILHQDEDESRARYIAKRVKEFAQQ